MSKLLVDVRPEFIRNEKERIFGSTRSILEVEPREVNFLFNKMKNIKDISAEVDISLYFLKSEDRDVELNPILLPESTPIADFGFKNIFEVNRINLKLTLAEKDKQTLVRLSTDIKSIFG